MRLAHWIVGFVGIALPSLLSSAERATVSFLHESISVSDDSTQITYAKGQPLPVHTTLTLSAFPVAVRLAPGESLNELSWSVDSVDFLFAIPVAQADIPTSAFDFYDPAAITVDSLTAGRTPIQFTGLELLDGSTTIHLLLSPVTVDSFGRILFNRQLRIRVGTRLLAPEEILQNAEPSRTQPHRVTSIGLPEFIIVTNAALAPACSLLSLYKNSTGIRTGVKDINQVCEEYPGRDDAEKLRNYLKDFYSSGGRFVLLAGDETVLPVRYLSHFDRNATPELLDLLPGDIYFADTDGEWDVDADGIWGEPYQDRPSLIAELKVGRLPVTTAGELTNYMHKLTKYETNPGNGDRDYLTRSLFFSSDQMRDFSNGGQHGRIASAFPENFVIDTSIGVEAARGDDPSPTNLPAAELDGRLDAGIIHVIAHGRPDGFVVRSDGINGRPKSMLLTEAESGLHGCFDSVHQNSKSAFYYSLACDNGGFDMDAPPFLSDDVSMVQHLIGSKNGAIGMVAYTRWGWVSSSHLLQKTFFDSLFAHPNEPAINAMHRSHRVYPHYRDLIYGQNYYGDPTLRLYTQQPSELNISALLESGLLSVSVQSSSGALNNCRLHLSSEGELLETFPISSTGLATFEYSFDPLREYQLTAVADNALITQAKIFHTIVTGVEDDNDALPNSFALRQNYPNPFNPSTQITFDLPKPCDVHLRLYNILGELVDILTNREYPAGIHTVTWNRLGNSREIASGIYFYELIAGDFHSTRKMLLMK